jgi:rod shape-determining protein MreD
MRSVAIPILMVTGFGLQAVLWPDVTLQVQPAFLLIIAMIVGFNRGLQAGFWFAFASGLVLDFYVQRQFGLFTFAMTAAYLPVFIYWQTRVSELTVPTKLTLVVTSACLYELLVVTGIRLGNSAFPFFAELARVATLNVIGSVVAFAVLAPLFGTLFRPSPHERPV